MRRLSYQEIKSQIVNLGYTLLVDMCDYINTRQSLKVKCRQCDCVTETTLSNLRRMKGCKHCAANRIRSYDEIQQLFADAGCCLLTPLVEYKPSEKVDYRCKCGTKSTISVHAFSIGQRCFGCGRSKRSGENHPYYHKGYLIAGDRNPNWNPALTSDERRLRQHRGDHRYKIWRKSVYTRDDYTCQKCRRRGGALNVHHVENFSEKVEKRYDIENGITFCKKCHDDFHRIYGKMKNNKQQIKEYCNALLFN